MTCQRTELDDELTSLREQRQRLKPRSCPYNDDWWEMERIDERIAEIEFEQFLPTLSPVRRLVAEAMWDRGLFSDGGREARHDLEDIIVSLCLQAQRLAIEPLPEEIP